MAVSQGYRKLFNNKERLYLLLNLRIEGYTINSLSMVFHCDKASVREQCKKYYIFPEFDSFSLKREISHILTLDPQETRRWVLVDGERINKGRSYADYLKKAGY